MKNNFYLSIIIIFFGCGIFDTPDETPPEIDFYYPLNINELWLRDTLKCYAQDDNKISWIKFILKINDFENNEPIIYELTEEPYHLPISLIDNHLDSIQIYIEASDGENIGYSRIDTFHVNNDQYPQDSYHDGDAEFLYEINFQVGIIDSERTVWNYGGDIYRIRELNYWNLNIDSLPETFQNLSSLIELNLNNNNLETLPQNIGKLTSLIELRLAHNKIYYLPDELGNLENLEVLELNGNYLDSIPQTTINLKNLEILRLHNNSLDWIPDLSQFYDLEYLYLAWNQLTEINISCEMWIFDYLDDDPTSTNQNVTIDNNKLCYNIPECLEPILGFQDCFDFHDPLKLHNSR